MFRHKSIPLAVITAALLLTPLAYAQQDSALLELLVKKGIITQSEAKGLRAELAKKPEPKPEPQAADKLKLSKPLMELELMATRGCVTKSAVARAVRQRTWQKMTPSGGTARAIACASACVES